VSTNFLRESTHSVADCLSDPLALDKELLTKRVGKLPRAKLDLILSGIDVVLGR
jgi:hypothetical protein